jgi:hypothetical protein
MEWMAREAYSIYTIIPSSLSGNRVYPGFVNCTRFSRKRQQRALYSNWVFDLGFGGIDAFRVQQNDAFNFGNSLSALKQKVTDESFQIV